LLYYIETSQLTQIKLVTDFTQVEKIPPQNLEAEMSLLGAILIDKEALLKIADILEPDDFYKPAHAEVYQAILDLYAKSEPVDILTLSNRLEERGVLEKIGGRSFVVSLANTVPTASHVKHYADIVARKATLRKLIGAASEISRLGFTEDSDEIEMLLDKAQQHVFSVTQKHIKQTFTPIRGILSEAFDRIDELHRDKGKLRGVPTGFRELDNILAGLQKSDLIILAARPSVGKTSLALDIARHVAIREKVPVGIFSLEMSKEQFVDRLLCAEAGVDLWKMRTGNLSDRPDSDDFPRIGHAMGVLSEAPIYIDDFPGNNVMQIRTKARRLKSEHGLGLIIIDYMQLMESHNNKYSENRVQEVSEMSRNLKGIARELNVPVLALSQLSRAVEQTKPAIPKLSHLRESGCLTGDTIIIRADTGEPVRLIDIVTGKIPTPLPIFALDENWKISPQIMTKAFSSGQKKVFEMRLRSGRTIRASANHPFRTLGGWTNLEDLCPGMRIAVPRVLTPQKPTNLMNLDELALLAHLLGDGCTVPRQPIHYTSADPENLAVVEQTAIKLFNIKPRRVKQKNWWHVYLPSPYHLTHGKHHPITNWFSQLGIGLRHSYKKEIPLQVFQSDSSHIAHFLRHLWATDGNISWKFILGRKPAGAIYYSSTSTVLARQVQHLLTRLGIFSTLRLVPQGDHRPAHQVHVQGSTNQKTFLSVVGSAGSRGDIVPAMLTALQEITANPNRDTIPHEIWNSTIEEARTEANISWRELYRQLDNSYAGTVKQNSVGRERLGRIAVALKSKPLQLLADSSIFWDEIESIVSQGMEEVYDATVPRFHNFVANDIIVHNSIEQDADVVLFIYRKAADRNYRLEDIPPDERHLGEIHVAKHRNGPTGMAKVFFDETRASYRNLDTRYVPPTGGGQSHAPANLPKPGSVNVPSF